MRIQQESLTPDYFNVLKVQYPLGMKVFLEWIDEYKKTVNWSGMFNSGIDVQPGLSNSKKTIAPKYHDLPGAMQLGIFIEFMKQRGGCEYGVDLFELELREEFEGAVKMLQTEQELEQPEPPAKAKVVLLPENSTGMVNGLLSANG
jgi:hypothetical protein